MIRKEEISYEETENSVFDFLNKMAPKPSAYRQKVLVLRNPYPSYSVDF
jgi:hypothetical protein